MLADEDVAGGGPCRARKAPGQLAGRGHGLLVARAVLQRVGEEEERLVGVRCLRVFLQQFSILEDRFGAGVGRCAPIAHRGCLVPGICFRLGADAQREPAPAKQRGQPAGRLGLLGVGAAQLQHPPQHGFLLLFLLRDHLLDVPVQEVRVAGRLRDGSGDQEREHGLPP